MKISETTCCCQATSSRADCHDFQHSSFTLESASRCRLRGQYFAFGGVARLSIGSDQDLGALSMTSLRHSILFQSFEKACYSCDDPPPNRMATGERATFAGDHSLPFVRLIPPSFNQLSSNNLLVTPHSYPSINLQSTIRYHPTELVTTSSISSLHKLPTIANTQSNQPCLLQATAG